MNLCDTIAAIATSPGRGGIGIVRISGPDALRIASALVRTSRPLASWSPARGGFLDIDGAPIDDVLVTWFPKPRSYTAEDVVEIACHGAPVVLRRCLERCVASGARLAEPGEFTLRAFLNGRIDLSQAEAIRDLIEATTLHQARVAARQTSGALAHAIVPVKKRLIDLISLLEAGIDFAEDDVSIPSAPLLRSHLDPIEEAVERFARTFAYGNVLREGFSLAIVGRPNVGKSSLFNRLLEQDRAIVTDAPGTTRDLVSEVTALEGIPVRLMDTAGIRAGETLAESLGIERSYQAMADADVTLVVVDAAAPLGVTDRVLLERARDSGRWILAANKCDAGSNIPEGGLPVSALTGQGIDRLRRRILETVAPGGESFSDGAIITNLRQQTALEEAQAALRQTRLAVDNDVPHEMLLLHLYDALAALDTLTGKTTADDILYRIFATFCIGK